ncbi:MaoC family dehydratase [bacterium D16-50]|jgi:acyl dehydratase|nr:MaoC family dehydratase [Lachnospiraceae bacterium]RKJ17897.1 MaoC family dehydratase [bacterium D16-50]
MLKVGDSYAQSFTATDQTIRDIAKVSGDINPIHLDEAYASKSIFGRRIAHGLFCLNAISMILGNHFPGMGTILLSQSFEYKAPVYIGDVITVEVTVTEAMPKGVYLLSVVCQDQNRRKVLTGISKVKWENGI